MKFSLDSKYVLVFSVLALFVLLNTPYAQSLGVTRPVPHDVELMIGEEAGFRFQIQATTSTTDISCIYSFSGLDPLEITFQEEEVIIEAGKIKDIYGTLSVPENAEIKDYGGKLSVSCGAVEEGSGSSVRTTIGDSPFNVKVVEERGKEIRDVAPPPVQVDYLFISIAIVSVILIIILFYFRRKGR